MSMCAVCFFGGRRQADEIDRLRRELAEAKELNAYWFRANAPGGWMDQQRRKLAEAREWIQKNDHPIDCELGKWEVSTPCTCGRDALLKSLEVSK